MAPEMPVFKPKAWKGVTSWRTGEGREARRGRRGRRGKRGSVVLGRPADLEAEERGPGGSAGPSVHSADI